MVSDTVDSDLSCASCGYNLRTLNVAGRCPECGEAVILSVKFRPFRFGNPETPKRVQNGVALFVVGVLASTVLMLLLTAVLRLVYVLPEVLLRTAYSICWYSAIGAQLLPGLGLILATWPYGRRGDRFAWPLGVAVLIAIAVSATPDVARFVRWCLTGDGGLFSMGTTFLLLGSAADCASFLALTLAWAHLLARVRYIFRNRALWLTMLAVVLLHVLLFASSVSSYTATLQYTKHASVSGGVLVYMGPVPKSLTLVSLLGVSGHRISGFVSLVTLCALWFYVRKLRKTTDLAQRAEEPA